MGYCPRSETQYGLRHNLKDGRETCHHNFDPPRRAIAPPHWYSQMCNLNGNLKDIAPTMVLHASCAISGHNDVSQASLEPGLSGPELSTLPIGQHRFYIRYITVHKYTVR